MARQLCTAFVLRYTKMKALFWKMRFGTIKYRACFSAKLIFRLGSNIMDKHILFIVV